MMASQAEGENPLIAALPPQTDYITYLTILEYQLTPANLPTLTSLLANDDGTLAQEIGWDLLKLVLPLSEEVPEEAGRCLEVVARRGNPREVVVRVAEELETLGYDDENSGTDQEFGDDESGDELRTFPGEAERIHLGPMILQGMPTPSDQRSGEESLDQEDEKHARRSHDHAISSTKFQILLSMLSVLHARIQTKYPSRFLATSLPATLSSYRRLAIDSATTKAFLSLLAKLSGKQRPTLPPRTSTADTAEIHLNSATTAETKPAPLPDPEADSETPSSSTLSADEAAITKRLLQAVLLEVLEEYVLSLATQEPSSMSWTARIRENREPERIVPGRRTETEEWKANPTLQERDTLMANIVRLSKDLEIDLKTTGKQTLNQETTSTKATAEEGAAAPDAGSPLEYPTSPEQVAFPRIGVFLIFVAQYFVPALAAPLLHPDGTAAHKEFLDSVYLLSGVEDPRNHPALCDLSVPALDFLLATLYTAVRADYVHAPLPMLLFLTALCSENPDPYIRGSAHAIATVIFCQSPPETKLALVKHVLGNSQNPNLRAVAVDWLKDDLAGKGTSRLHSDILTTDAELGDALCVPLRNNDLVFQLPFRVAVLKLLTIAPTEQGDWLIHSLTRERNDFSDAEAQRHGISAIDLWSFDDALQRAKDAFAKQDPALRPQWTRKDEWLVKGLQSE
jgi:hypothetical protein